MLERLEKEYELKEKIKEYIESFCIADVSVVDVFNMENCHTKIRIIIINKYFPNFEYKYTLDLFDMLFMDVDEKIKTLDNVLTDYKQTIMKYFFYRR